MFALIVAFALLALQPMPMTVDDCLRMGGYPGAPDSAVAQVRGTPAPEWEQVLQAGAVVGVTYIATDSARRLIVFYVYAGSVYVFVGKHPDDPGVRLPGEARSVVHGQCLLRVGA